MTILKRAVEMILFATALCAHKAHGAPVQASNDGAAHLNCIEQPLLAVRSATPRRRAPTNTISTATLRHQIPKEARKLYDRARKTAARGTRADVEAAAKDLERAVAIDPLFADAHGILGVRYYSMMRLTEAVAQFRRALNLNPAFSFWHSDLAWALFTLGDTEGALQSVRRALELAPDNTSAHLLLGAMLATSPDTHLQALQHLGVVEDALGHEK